MPARRKWLKLGLRLASLAVSHKNTTSSLVTRSYDCIARGYDSAWTSHMRDLSIAMLDKLTLPACAQCIDLTCGTGFLSGQLAQRGAAQVVGVDRSAGMLEVARNAHAACTFVQSDVVDFLKARPSASADIITCGWGLGYSQPASLIGHIARVLRPGGQVGIIDNSLFSLAGVLWCSLLAFAERPEAMEHVMKVRFLPSSFVLAGLMRLGRLRVLVRYDGAKTYHVPSGDQVISRLRTTGAAAGFEFAGADDAGEAIFQRFAQLYERYRTQDGLPITHRYLAAVGRKQA